MSLTYVADISEKSEYKSKPHEPSSCQMQRYFSATSKEVNYDVINVMVLDISRDVGKHSLSVN